MSGRPWPVSGRPWPPPDHLKDTPIAQRTSTNTQPSKQARELRPQTPEGTPLKTPKRAAEQQNPDPTHRAPATPSTEANSNNTKRNLAQLTPPTIAGRRAKAPRQHTSPPTYRPFAPAPTEYVITQPLSPTNSQLILRNLFGSPPTALGPSLHPCNSLSRSLWRSRQAGSWTSSEAVKSALFDRAPLRQTRRRLDAAPLATPLITNASVAEPSGIG